MNDTHRLFLLHGLTPLHVGVDDSLGAVDQPTMRERHTGYPLIPGSSVKGVLRQAAESTLGDDKVEAAFGPPSTRAGDFRGGLVFTDAQLLALPIRSLCGTFAWVTAPSVLRRLAWNLDMVSPSAPLPSPEVANARLGLVPAGEGEERSALLIPSKPSHVFVEDLLLKVEGSQELRRLAQRVATWFWPDDSSAREFFRQRLLLVHEDLFNLLVRLCLEVRSRVKIDAATGTAAASGPWTEEHMPTETLLHGLAYGRPTRLIRRGKESEPPAVGDQGEPWKADRNLRILTGLAQGHPVLRFGGQASIGLGRARFLLSEGGTPGEGR